MILNVDFGALDEALRRMGAKPVASLPPAPVQPIDSIDIEFDIELEKGVILPDLKDVETLNGLLSYKGRQILLYIQDHGGKAQDALDDGQKGNKFHFADCQALQTMRARGRYERYVVTNRLDGEFFISGVDWKTKRDVEGHARLWVCRYCLKALNYKGATHGNTLELAKHFDIGEFFSTYSSFFTHLPRRRAGNSKEEGYTPDWPQIAGRFKSDKDFKCESCGVDLGAHKNLLHVHHRNGVKGDNRSANLAALCAACHRKQAQHEHMFVRHADMRTINHLRAEQGQFRVADWDTVLEYCDPALHGLLDACKCAGAARPEIGLDVQDGKSAVVANLEVAWPRAKVGVAITDEDRHAAVTAGWRVWEMIAALQDIRTFVTATRGRKS